MGYFDDTCFSCPPLPKPFVVPGITQTITVLSEAALLALQSGEINVGGDVIIILPTSKTLAYGVVKYTFAGGTGWSQFTITGNPIPSTGGVPLWPTPSGFTDASMFPGNAFPATGLYFAGTVNQLWSFTGGDTQWRYADLISA